MKFKCDGCTKLVSQKEVIVTADGSFAGAICFYCEKCYKEKLKNG